MLRPKESEEPDFGLVLDFVESLECENPVEGYAVIAGAQSALESYWSMSAKGQETTIRDVISETVKQVVAAEEYHSDPWKRSDEFIVGAALGAFLARRADAKDMALRDVKGQIEV